LRAGLLSGVVLAGVSLAGSGGCIAVGGAINPPTRGQELIDLKSALDRGAMSQAECDAQKAQILSRK
jgi:hypothetical protein